MEGVWLEVGLALITLTGYALCERLWAQWLPWWRRGLSCLPLALKLTLGIASLVIGCSHWPDARLLLGLVSLVIWHWNFWTSRRNRRDGNDQRKLEASRSERLTEVQAAALRRQVTEVASA